MPQTTWRLSIPGPDVDKRFDLSRGTHYRADIGSICAKGQELLPNPALSGGSKVRAVIDRTPICPGRLVVHIDGAVWHCSEDENGTCLGYNLEHSRGQMPCFAAAERASVLSVVPEKTEIPKVPAPIYRRPGLRSASRQSKQIPSSNRWRPASLLGLGQPGCGS